MTRPALSRRHSGLRTPLIGAVVVAAVVGGAIVSGTLDAANTTLVVMGFDTDRAQLISSLLIAGVAAAGATLATSRGRQATLLGLGGFAVLFGPTFLTETGNALASNGSDGSFDLSGWLLTVLTLLTVGVIASWAGTALALSLRPGLIEAGLAVRDTVASRHLDRRRLRQPFGAALVLVLLILTVPVFGDMVNYTPDSRMLHGGPPPVGLVPDGAVDSTAPPVGTPEPTVTSTLSSTPQPTGAGVSSTPQSAPSMVDAQPWLSWRPSGSGSVAILRLQAPWKGGSSTTAEIAVYTPPGYERSGSRRYPVLYEAPTTYSFWDSATNIKVVLDTLIDSGAIPAMLVVFIASGGPYPDTECANSVDHMEWMDTYIGETVVSYVDSHYATIAQASARAVVGMSQGGYCAAILTLHHPTVFGTAIPFSGYFQAGLGGATSKLPFGGNAAALSAASPMVVATELPASERTSLFFIIVAEPGQPFYGSQAAEFEKLLAAQGYSYVAENASVPHGWVQVRRIFPAALEAWAAHMVSAGVFQA